MGRLGAKAMRPTIIRSRALGTGSVRVQGGPRIEAKRQPLGSKSARGSAVTDASRGDANAYGVGTTALPHQHLHLQASGGCHQQAGTRRMLNLFCSFFFLEYV